MRLMVAEMAAVKTYPRALRATSGCGQMAETAHRLSATVEPWEGR